MKYLHVLLAAACEPWALEHSKLLTVARFIAFQAAGGKLSAEEVQARIGKGREAEIAKAPGSIAVIPVVGVLSQRANMLDEISGGTSTEILGQQIRAALADETVKAIVLDIDSPGGTVSGTEEIAREIYGSRGIKPIVAQVNSCAASAAYWIATAADEIAATPSARAGSIGVYSIHEDISKMLEQEGVRTTLISSSPEKVDGNEFEPLSESARADIQRSVDYSNAAFVKAVARGRGVSQAEVADRFGRGRVFDADELLKRGMVDRIATMSETLERFGARMGPVPATSIAAAVRQAGHAETLRTKLLAGDPPTVRELEKGLREALSLSGSEAERAVKLCFDSAQGEPGAPTDHPPLQDAFAELRSALAGFKLPSIP